MNKIINLLILTLSTLLLHGQGALTPTWSIVDSVPLGSSEAWGIDVDNNDHIYWVVNNDLQNQGLDIICRKFAVGGQELWATPFSFGGIGTQQGYVCNASDTAIYIGGRNCTGLINTCDMLLLKVNKTSGELHWSKTRNFAANGYEEIDGLEITADGIYCGGWCQELNSSIYQSDIGLWKLDFSGNTVWSNYLGVDGTAEHQDGHFVVDQTGIFATGLWGGRGIANLYNGYSFLGKFDLTDGTLIDSTLYGYQSDAFNDIENALGMTSDGTYLYTTGYTTPIRSDDWQISVTKFDKNLNQIWSTDWGGSGSESARGIVVENGIIYVAGLTESTSLMSGGSRDALLLTMDTSGHVLSFKTFGGAGKESFRDLAVHNQNIYLTGVIEENLGESKSMLIALEKESTSSHMTNDSENTFSIYPNPSRGETTVEFLHPEHQEGTLNVYNNLGQIIRTDMIRSGTNKIQLNMEHRGLLYIEMAFPTYRVTKSIVNNP